MFTVQAQLYYIVCIYGKSCEHVWFCITYITFLLFHEEKHGPIVKTCISNRCLMLLEAGLRLGTESESFLNYGYNAELYTHLQSSIHVTTLMKKH